MPVPVPCQRRHAIAVTDAHRIEGVGKPLGTFLELAVRGAVDVTFDASRDDLDVAMMTRRMA